MSDREQFPSNRLLQSAIECLRDIAAMSKKVGSETAANWLQAHGIPREEGGYVPGKGHADVAPTEQKQPHCPMCGDTGVIEMDCDHCLDWRGDETPAERKP